ncbi:hypothetical protein NQ318_017121 [Aromia moschata]|uniref:Uncharacterized protein n=1 Tax=Aromia moschata TaxID=1265417 RepID=A0AAV8XHY6_9CUCU|nr:hypothetical protein NQ318_017121 [Aromia moschata]
MIPAEQHGFSQPTLSRVLKRVVEAIASHIGDFVKFPEPHELGHTVGETLLESTRVNVDLLTKLIAEHDIIFLLMDSRESRWLATLLAKFHNKIVVNAALGFDTYLVMRHGIRNDNLNIESIPKIEVSNSKGFKSIRGTDLGCYFCNDVTAPGNTFFMAATMDHAPLLTNFIILYLAVPKLKEPTKESDICPGKNTGHPAKRK